MTAGFDPAGNHASKVSVPESETWRWLLERPMKYPPGSHFDYDEAEQNLLSIVLTRAIKQDAGAFAERNLFAPLHIVDHHRVSEADGYLLGATGLFLTGRDMAKLGLLYLQRGRWGENQIVSDAFVIDSTTKHNEGGAPSHAAYGYFWWTKPTKAGLDAFFAAGHNSQLIYVIPKLDLVVAVAAEKIPGEAWTSSTTSFCLRRPSCRLRRHALRDWSRGVPIKSRRSSPKRRGPSRRARKKPPISPSRRSASSRTSRRSARRAASAHNPG